MTDVTQTANYNVKKKMVAPFMGVSVTICHLSQELKSMTPIYGNAKNQIAPIPAALIAATVAVEPGRCWLRDEDGVAREYRCADTLGIVTYAGREWNTSAAQLGMEWATLEEVEALTMKLVQRGE